MNYVGAPAATVTEAETEVAYTNAFELLLSSEYPKGADVLRVAVRGSCIQCEDRGELCAPVCKWADAHAVGRGCGRLSIQCHIRIAGGALVTPGFDVQRLRTHWARLRDLIH